MTDEKQPIKPGDVVQLKSGGVAMTAGVFGDDERDIHCYWQLNGEHREQYYPKVSLVRREQESATDHPRQGF